MHCLIRHAVQRPTGAVEVEEKAYVVEHLRLGRGRNQDVQFADIRVALQHALIEFDDDKQLCIRALVPSGVRHNQRSVQSSGLKVGDVIGIGGYEARVIEPPVRAFDLALEIQKPSGTRGRDMLDALISRSVFGLNAAGMRKRSLAWLLLGCVLCLFFIVPLLGYFIHPLGNVLQKVPLVSELFWATRPVHKSHEHIAQQCDRCHTSAFRAVTNESCLACHVDTRHHLQSGSKALSVFPELRCGSCHEEHTDAKTFVRHDQSLCTDCHAHLRDFAAETQVLDVLDFGKQHPQFRISLPSRDSGDAAHERRSLDFKLGLREQPNLQFSHQQHLRSEGLDHPQKGIVHLECGNCHAPEAGGALMAPIRFATHCHECHRLTFDRNDPRREVPHGDVQAVQNTLKDYYASQALRGGYVNNGTHELMRVITGSGPVEIPWHYSESQAPATVQERRRPGEPLPEAQRLEALDWATRYAHDVTAELIEYRSCATCHDVERAAKLHVDQRSEWRIAPVRMPPRWFPSAVFSHEQHKAKKCTECHTAPKSDSSEDVMLPGIETCRECHGGAHEQGKAGSTCIECHKYHASTQLTIGKGGSSDNKAAERKENDKAQKAQ
jgi:hypothetical protein